jgi:hypothetical protein
MNSKRKWDRPPGLSNKKIKPDRPGGLSYYVA